MNKSPFKETRVLVPYDKVVHKGIFTAPEFGDWRYCFGYASIPRGESKRLNIEYLVPRRYVYMGCPRNVFSCLGRFAGYKYISKRGEPICTGNGAPRALYKCKHGVGDRAFLVVYFSKEHPIKRYRHYP